MKRNYFTLSFIISSIFMIIAFGAWRGIISIPELAAPIFSVAAVGFAVFGAAKGKDRIWLKVISVAMSIVYALSMLYFAYVSPSWNSSDDDTVYTLSYDAVISYKEAKSDLDYAVHYFKKLHPITKDGLPPEAEAAYEAANNNLKNAQAIDVSMLNREIQRIFSVIGDAHTNCYTNYEDYHFLKYLRNINKSQYKLVEVDGVCLDELFDENSYLFSYESERDARLDLLSRFGTLEGLYFLGYDVKDGVTYTYEDKDGYKINYIYTDEDFLDLDSWFEFYGEEKPEENKEKEFFKYKIDEEKSLAVLDLYECKNTKEYRECLENMFAEIKEKNIRNVAVDLRANTGGNPEVIREFLRYIDVDEYKIVGRIERNGLFVTESGGVAVKNQKAEDLAFDGNVYALTSVYTFSAAMEFAQYIKDNGIGKIIGEASGNTVDFYGGVFDFVLPESKLRITVSTTQVTRIDREAGEKFLIPDVECSQSDVYNVLYSMIA